MKHIECDNDSKIKWLDKFNSMTMYMCEKSRTIILKRTLLYTTTKDISNCSFNGYKYENNLVYESCKTKFLLTNRHNDCNNDENTSDQYAVLNEMAKNVKHCVKCAHPFVIIPKQTRCIDEPTTYIRKCACN
jgi:DNA-directed RNA polymerase subunit M/transcription elongation factor TFIIS